MQINDILNDVLGERAVHQNFQICSFFPLKLLYFN